MAKPKTLNQIVAIEKTVKQRTYSAIDAIYKKLQKPEPFSGFTKTYTPHLDIDSGGEALPPETKMVEAIVRDLLAEVARQQTELFDVVACKDKGNRSASADVVLDDGTVILSDVPATTLLFLEKQCIDMRTMAAAIPTLSAAEEWTHDLNSRLYRSGRTQTTRSLKIEVPLIIVPSTPEHPAQAKTIMENKVVGIWDRQDQSGLLPRPEKEQLLLRLDAFIKAVKQARERANMVEVEPVSIGKAVFGYLFG